MNLDCDRVGRDNVVGIAIGWVSKVRGSNAFGGRGFPHPPRPALGPTQRPVHVYPVIPEGKAPGAWR